MRYPLKFNFPDGYDEHQLVSELADHFSIKKDQSIFESFAFYDTFDWRLFSRSLVLYKSGNNLVLRKLFESTHIHKVVITSIPVFLWDFPDGELKDQLSSILKMRALLKLAEVHSRSTPYRIFNQDEKTVARLICKVIRPSPDKTMPALATYMCLKPVKGYPKYFQNVCKLVQKAGLVTRIKEDIYFDAFRTVDKIPGDFSTKLNIQLDPGMHSDEATKIILRFLLQIIRINEANIEKDLDTEFLHDYRVAIRRTRSALGQIKSVFSPEITRRFRKDFAFVGKLTNQLRDLDVFLLNEVNLKAMLPAVLRNDIEILFNFYGKSDQMFSRKSLLVWTLKNINVLYRIGKCS